MSFRVLFRVLPCLVTLNLSPSIASCIEWCCCDGYLVLLEVMRSCGLLRLWALNDTESVDCASVLVF